MTRLLLLILATIHISDGLSQKILFEKKISLKQGFEENREAYPVVDDINKTLTLFLVDKNTIKGFLFDNDLALIDSIEIAKPESKFSENLGMIKTNDVYKLFFSSRSYKELVIVSFNFVSKKITQIPIDLPLQKEKYAGSIIYNNNFYLLTVKRRASLLTLYAFTDQLNYTVHTFDFKDEHFMAPPYYTLFDAVRENEMESIDNEIPNAIELVAKKNKLYCFDNKMVLTFDNLYLNTKVITIDLLTFGSDLRTYRKSAPVDCSNVISVSSNSYVNKNKLYQFFVCSMGMELSITNLIDGKNVKRFPVTKEQELYFKNTPVIQLGTAFPLTDRVERELDKTKQFLRKVAAGSAGVCAYENSAGIEVTLGGYQVQNWGAPVGGGGMRSLTINTPGGEIYVPSYYPTYNALNSYKISKSIYFKTFLATSTFEHMPEIVPTHNILDMVANFTKPFEDDTIAETLFRRDGVLILGYYSKKARSYTMRQFID